jgi:hypothetical protein
VPEYVYGVVEPGGVPPDAPGIDGAPLRLIGGDGVAAIVSTVAGREPAFDRTAMAAHARVLEVALEQGNVLPMRFGVVMEAEEVQERLLGLHGDQLRAQLEHLAGTVELGVRVVYEHEPLLREVLAGEPQIAALRAQMQGRSQEATYYERIRLGELVAEAVERRRAADGQELLDGLAPVSLAVRASEPGHERVVLNAAFLVDRGAIADFDGALDRLAAERAGRMRVKCVGPVAPHSFVELEAVG